jgi:hypothetical protein
MLDDRISRWRFDGRLVTESWKHDEVKMTVNIRELEKILKAKIQLMDLPNPVAAMVVAIRLVPVILDIVRRELRTELKRRDRIKENLA